jgi:hypothetical protein
VSYIAARLIKDVTEALTFIAREVPKGLAAGHRSFEHEINKAADAFDAAENKLALAAKALDKTNGKGHNGTPAPGTGPGTHRIGTPGESRGPSDGGTASTPGDATSTTDGPLVHDPHDHGGPDTIDHTAPGGHLIPPDYDRYGGKSKAQFLHEHWDPTHVNTWDQSRGAWRYPPQEGFERDHYGVAIREPFDLPVGFRMDRKGGVRGSYVSPEGTPFPDRALPPDSLDQPYHAYEVVKPFDAESGIPEIGRIAPAFDQSGGGVQYKLPQSVKWLIANEYIKEIWL